MLRALTSGVLVYAYFIAFVAGTHPRPGWDFSNIVPAAFRSLLQSAGIRFGPISFEPSAIVQQVASKLEGANRHPIIFIPPLTGTQLDMAAKDQGDVPFFLCTHDFPKTLGWLNPLMMLPGWFSCWVDRFSLTCDLPAGTPCRAPYGVSVSVRPGFASAMSLDPWGLYVVFADVVAALQKMGWKQGVDMDAHGYDFRLSPLDHMGAAGGYAQLKAQIEQLVQKTGKPVVAIALSMGSVYGSTFLGQYVDQDWKETNVKAFISVSGFWGDAPSAPIGISSGVWGSTEKWFAKVDFVKLARHLPVLSWLTPATQAFGSAPLIVNTARNRSYAAGEVGDMLRHSGAHQAAAIWKAVRGDHMIPAPNVTLYCFYGTQLPTPASATYSTPDFSDSPVVAYAPGDGSIPIQSLRACREPGWQGARTVVREFPGANHVTLLHERDGFHAVLDAVADIHHEQRVGVTSA